MKRIFFKGDSQREIIKLLFGNQEDFSWQKYAAYREIEVVVQEDGRYSVLGNLQEDSDLLQDTRKDKNNMVNSLLQYPCVVEQDAE